VKRSSNVLAIAQRKYDDVVSRINEPA
jgi:hypothetical protein